MSAADFNLGSFGTSGNVSTCLGAFFDLSLSSSSKISWVVRICSNTILSLHHIC